MTTRLAFPRQTIETYLIQILTGFQQDPPNTPFQEGYLAALEELCRAYCPHLKRRFNIS